MSPKIKKSGLRPNSAVVVGALLGDEGKGRITDELVAHYLENFKEVVVYRDNGGANAGHTVKVGDKKIALHQLGSGILHSNCTIVLGKEMVLHPEDLLSEIKLVEDLKGSVVLKQIKIDQMTVLSLDTHRAFETALKIHNGSGKGSTGRGISPAYADIVYRHPLRMRDLFAKDWQKKFKAHYLLYEKLVRGFNLSLSEMEVTRISGEKVKLGLIEPFLERLAATRVTLKKITFDLNPFLEKTWHSKIPFVFEKAQALGLDKRWGLYPDVTASNCAPDGIFSSTEGIIDPREIEIKAAVIKSTYTSSVGSRLLPTIMGEKLAERIRKDANEYGSTTKRPRDIAYLDLPMLSFLCRVGRIEKLVFTHMDIVYPDVKVKVCVAYEINGKRVAYRPDQEFLNQVKPIYQEFSSWDLKILKNAKKFSDLPIEAQNFIEFVSRETKTKALMLTFGPARSESLFF